MTDQPPKESLQVQRIETRYRNAPHFNWYQPDLGQLTEFIQQPIWTLSTWSPEHVEMIGSHSSDMILLVDNTYVGSFAFNAVKIEIASQLLPGEENYQELLTGNLKKFVAEQIWLHHKSTNSARFIIEYLYEFNGRNRELDRKLRALPDGHDIIQMIANVITFMLLLHEVGHIAYSRGHYRSATAKDISAAINQVVGPNHTHERLEEEAFCDFFGLVNSIIELNRTEGWPAESLCNVATTALTAALLCVQTKEIALKYHSADEPLISMSPANNLFMARSQVAEVAINQAVKTENEHLVTPSRSLNIFADTLDIKKCWMEACNMPCLDDEVSNLSLLLAQAFCEPERGGFDHVVRKLNLLSPLHDLSKEL